MWLRLTIWDFKTVEEEKLFELHIFLFKKFPSFVWMYHVYLNENVNKVYLKEMFKRL